MSLSSLVILDFGSQYTQLIARRVRELGVYCEIHPYFISQSAFTALNPVGVILSGGPASVTNDQDPKVPLWLFELNLPILGICYGMQGMAVALGGRVLKGDVSEFGHADVQLISKSALFEGLGESIAVWMSHGDQVSHLPDDFQVLAKTIDTPIAAMAHIEKPWFGVQFHPEVTHTPEGQAILSRFLFECCHASINWTPKLRLDSMLADLKAQVGKDDVLLGLSGGVDSSVVALLLHRAIGSQLKCVFVDTGLLRLNEAKELNALFAEHLRIPVITVSAETQFIKALKGVTCPEKKRKIIGHTFIEVFESEARKLPNVKWLAQGTIYPDVIESAAVGGKHAHEVIKSHHNVGGLPEDLALSLLEPIRTLFKDEVRQLGLDLGLPHALVFRHPFPGPGLGVRVLGEIQPAFVDIVRRADSIFIEILREKGLYHEVSQAFAVFLPVKTVGVVGDARAYEYVIALRAVQTLDFMTAVWAKLPWDVLDEAARRITNEVPGVSRVVYDVSGKPPATIEWE